MYETNSFSATTSKAVQETHRSMRKNTYISLAFFVLIFVGVTLYSYITGATDIVAACDDKVLGAYGADITVFAQYTDIQSAELMESVDFGERLTGEEHKGTLIGTFIDIDDKINRVGLFLEKKFKKDGDKSSIAEGFMTGSLLFCVGAMTIVGSLNAGLKGDNTLLFTKSILDLISSCILASTLGVGVMFSALFVLVMQGGLVLLAGLLQNVLTDPALIAELTCAGSVMIIGISLNMLGVTKLKVANYLPALLLVPIFYKLWLLIPI